MSKPDIEQVKRALAVLYQPDTTIELRAIGQRIANGFYRNFDQLAKDACRLNTDFTPQANIYTCLNPIDSQLFARRPDQFAPAKRGEGVKDQDVICRRWLLIDLDPQKPSGVSATEQQRAAAIDLAKQVYRYLLEQLQFPKPVVADSGNGQHLLLRLDDLPNTPETKWACEQFLEHLHARFSNEHAHVDRGMFNAARICCLYGTVKRKGSDLPEQPHRLSRLLHIPDPLQSVSLAPLLAVVGRYPGSQVQPAVQQPAGSAWNIPQLLEARAIEYEADDSYQTSSGEQAARYLLEVCPFNAQHNDRSAVLLQWQNGAVAFRCHHDGCSGKDWQALKALWGLPDGESAVSAQDIILPVQTAPAPLLIVRSLDVQPEVVTWLWQDRLVMGGINLLCGRGGVGKTYQVCDLVGRITNQALTAPNGQPLLHGRVLYSTGEDHIAKIVEPRMQAHGADRSRLEYIKGQPAGTHVRLLDVIQHCDLLDTVLRQRPDTVALVLDPISAFQGDTDSNKVAGVRRFTGVLSHLAEAHDIAVLGIHHFNKGKRDIAGDSISGSHAYRDAARSVWLFALDAGDPTRRLMVCDKYNWAPSRPPGLAYRIECGVIHYEQEPLDMTSDELMDQGTEKPIDIASAWLIAQLSSGSQPAADLQIAATVQGISERTLERAKKRLGITSGKQQDRWFWTLPGSQKQ